jgi:hypothetical protein
LFQLFFRWGDVSMFDAEVHVSFGYLAAEMSKLPALCFSNPGWKLHIEYNDARRRRIISLARRDS